MQVNFLLSFPKKNKAPRQFWIKDDKQNQIKVYKNMEHTLELCGQPDTEFKYTISYKSGNLTINYKVMENLEEKPVNSDYINKQFTDEGDKIVDQARFNGDGKFYMKISGYCKNKPATLRIRLDGDSELCYCEIFIQFASDALIKALRKRKIQSLSENREDIIVPKTKKQKIHGLSITPSAPATLCPDFILETMDGNINMKALITKATALQQVPKFETIVVPPTFRQDYFNTITIKLIEINRLNTKLMAICNRYYGHEFLLQFNFIRETLDNLQAQLEPLQSEQLPLTIHYICERQALLNSIGNKLFDLLEEINDLEKVAYMQYTRIDYDSDANNTFTSMMVYPYNPHSNYPHSNYTP